MPIKLAFAAPTEMTADETDGERMVRELRKSVGKGMKCENVKASASDA